MTDLDYIAEQVTPGNPHNHSFALASPAKPPSWEGEAEFTVHRPRRSEMAQVNTYLAATIARAGPGAAATMNALEGSALAVEAYLSVMLDRAPECWWAKADGVVQNGEKANGKATARIVSFERIYEEDLDAVGAEVARYLASFGVRVPWTSR